MKKRLISVLLAVSMILSILPMGAVAADTSNAGPIEISSIISSGYPKGSGDDHNTSVQGTGWHYVADGSKYHGTLYLESGYRFVDTSGMNYFTSCRVVVEAGATVDNWDLWYGGTENHGTITNSRIHPWNEDGCKFVNSSSGVVDHCRLSEWLSDCVVENDGSITNSTFLGVNTNDWGQETHNTLHLSGNGRIDNSLLMAITENTGNTITNSAFTNSKQDFTGMKTIQFADSDAPTQFILLMYDCRAISNDRLEKAGFVGQPNLYIAAMEHGEYGNYSPSVTINSVNGKAIGFGVISGVTSVRKNAQNPEEPFGREGGIALTPDGTADIILSNAAGSESGYGPNGDLYFDNYGYPCKKDDDRNVKHAPDNQGTGGEQFVLNGNGWTYSVRNSNSYFMQLTLNSGTYDFNGLTLGDHVWVVPNGADIRNATFDGDVFIEEWNSSSSFTNCVFNDTVPVRNSTSFEDCEFHGHLFFHDSSSTAPSILKNCTVDYPLIGDYYNLCVLGTATVVFDNVNMFEWMESSNVDPTASLSIKTGGAYHFDPTNYLDSGSTVVGSVVPGDKARITAVNNFVPKNRLESVYFVDNAGSATIQYTGSENLSGWNVKIDGQPATLADLGITETAPKTITLTNVDQKIELTPVIGDAPTPVVEHNIVLVANSYGTLSAADANGTALSKAAANTKVYLNFTVTDTDYKFTSWTPIAPSDLTIEQDEAGHWFFTMPNGDVTISAASEKVNPTPDPIDPVDPVTPVDSDAGAGVAIVLGGAAIGGAAYLIGTQVYLTSVLPEGASIPTNRQQLADLLWTAAGKPQPASTALFTDISADAADSQKAARWCVEQGLLKDTGSTFKPDKHTFRPQVIKTWNDLQAKLNPQQ